MKINLFRILFSFLITISLTGCYTVLWTPNDNFPTDSNSDNQDDGFYPETYYGDYAPYYTTPWWYEITPPNNPGYVRDTSRSETFIRNDNGGRGSEPRNVLASPPPARIEPTNTGTTGSNNSNTSTNNSNSSNGNRVETTKSGNNSSARAGNSNNNTVRNNNGSRNTDGRR
jgi:hypothetical protein